ncbi:MAG: carboxymuconolactone decarboxylase family protein [Vicinamibacterales bacterium]
MAWIETIAPARAQGDLAEMYRRIAGARGGVADIHQVQSLNPRVLAAHFEHYKAIMFQPSPLSRAQREALAVAVSRANGCEYCVGHHATALAQLPPDPLDPRLEAWAARVARTPEQCSAADLEELRAIGLSDRAILDAILTVAYFSFANRLVLATGLALEAGYEATCRPE